jgi:hypothetical protein
MSQIGQFGQGKWALGLLASILVHGLAIFGLSRCSASRPSSEPTSIAMDLISVSEEGGVPIACPLPINSTNGNAATLLPREQSVTTPGLFVGRVANPFFDGSSGPSAGGDGQGAGAGSGSGKAVFFGVPAQGRRVVYVLDCSGSMGKNGALAAAKAELARSVQHLADNVRFQVIVYHDAARPLLASKPGWLKADAVHDVLQALSRLPAEGATNHALGLRAGLQLAPDDMFFLTDADDVTQEHLRLALQLNPQNRTAIHTIELNLANRNQATMPMQVLARLTHGTYQAVDLAKYR